MKLKFIKNSDGEITVIVDEKVFDTTDYLNMIIAVKNSTKIEVESFDESISEEEKDSINKMLKKINEIDFDEDAEETDSDEVDSDEQESENIFE